MTMEAGRSEADSGARAGLDALKIMSEHLGRPGRSQELLRALEALGRAVGASRCALYREDRETRSARRLAAWEAGDAPRESLGVISWADSRFSMLDRVVGGGRVLQLTEEDGPAVSALGGRSLAIAGIAGEGGRWGFLLAAAAADAEAWGSEDIALLDSAASFWGALARVEGHSGENRLQSMALESVVEAIMILDRRGCLRYVNPAFERMTGYGKAQAVGESLRLLESGEHPPEFYAEFWDHLSRGEGWSGILTCRKRDGTLYRQETNIVPVREDGGRVTDFVAVGRDVTKEMALEAQLRRAQKLESLGLLASGIAHDFNNVMGLVQGAVDRIRQVGGDCGPIDRYVDLILDAVKRGQSVSRRMLAFYRERDPRSEVFDIGTVLDELGEVCRHTFPRAITVSVSRAGGGSVVRGDRSQIHQALMNLCLNAAGAMREGGSLRLHCRPASQDEATKQMPEVDGPFVCVDVEDTGTGMGPEILEQIFDPYFSTKTTGSGTGLGLPIVFGIVKAQGGWVSVDSTQGKGSVFTVGLAASLDEPERAEVSEAGTARGSGETLLIVDDEPGIRMLMREGLEGSGYRVLEASDGGAALEVLSGADADVSVVVTDLGMADMGGAELIRHLGESHPGLPVIVTTGYFDPQLTVRLRDQGVKALLTKPFRLQELLEALGRVLRGEASPD